MAAINVLKKVTPYLDDVAGAVANYGDDAARLARNNGDDLAKLHRRLSQYDAATSRITPELLAAHPELGSKFANLTRRLGNEASLKMPITAQTGVNVDASVPSNALRSGLGGTLAGIFDDASTVVKNPNLFKDGNDAADYIYDRNLPNLKNIELLDSKRNANSGYIPTDALQGIESLTPPETLAEFFNLATPHGSSVSSAFDGYGQPIVSKNMFRSYRPYLEDSIHYPDGFGDPEDFAKYYDSLELGYVPDNWRVDSKGIFENQRLKDAYDRLVHNARPRTLPRSVSKNTPHFKQTSNQIFSTPMFEDDWWL